MLAHNRKTLICGGKFDSLPKFEHFYQIEQALPEFDVTVSLSRPGLHLRSIDGTVTRNLKKYPVLITRLPGAK
jgi:hypothetical protein